MTTTVEVAFELTVGDTPYFRVSNPIRGKLNNTTYKLAGAIFIDVTNQVAAVSISRGKNRELDRYSSGQASITLHNENRWFDPLNFESPYVGNIIPRREVRVSTSGVTQFTGLIEDWNLDYDVSGKSNAVIQAADAFTLLAQQRLTAGTATAETTAERVDTVLSMPSVAWPLTQRRIDDAQVALGADVFDPDQAALEYLQLVESSEQGQFFIDKDGYVRFIRGDIFPVTVGPFEVVATNLVTNPSFEASTSTVDTPFGVEDLPSGVSFDDPVAVFAWRDVDAKQFGSYGLLVRYADTRLSLTTESGGLFSTSSAEPWDVEGFGSIGLYNVRPEGDLVSVGGGFFELGV